jgi:tetratricopeptide (TPR) repeat protein
MTDVALFISCVSDEFRAYRDALRKALQSYKVTIHIQEDFIAGGKPTLDKLDRYIRACNGVIHLVGDMTGSVAKPASLKSIKRLCPDIVEQIPEIANAFDGLALSYTQWEAYLAIYHDKELVVAAPAEDAARERTTYVSDLAQRALQQQHLTRLAQYERYPVKFVDAKDLTLNVYRSTLYELLVSAGIKNKLALLGPIDRAAALARQEAVKDVARDKGVAAERLVPIADNIVFQEPDISPREFRRRLAERVDALRAAGAAALEPSNEGKDIDEVREATRAALREAKTDEAIAVLDRQLHQEREAIENRKRRTVTLLQDKADIERLRYDYTAARATLEELLRLDPDQVVSWGTLGDDWITVGSLDEAKRAFENALAAAVRLGDEANRSTSLERIGGVQMAQGNLADALQSYRDSHAIADRLARADPGNAGWQTDIIASNAKLALAGDEPEKRWHFVVERLRALKAEDRLTAKQANDWLPVAEAELAKLRRK